MSNFYASIEQVAEFATDNGFPEWEELTTDEKKQILFFASNDIEISIGKPRNNPRMPYGRGNPDLAIACQYQALHVMQTKDFRQLGQQIGALTNQSYSDGIVSIGSSRKEDLHPMAKAIIASFKNQNSVSSGYEFGRG